MNPTTFIFFFKIGKFYFSCFYIWIIYICVYIYTHIIIYICIYIWISLSISVKKAAATLKNVVFNLWSNLGITDILNILIHEYECHSIHLILFNKFFAIMSHSIQCTIPSLFVLHLFASLLFFSLYCKHFLNLKFRFL